MVTVLVLTQACNLLLSDHGGDTGGVLKDMGLIFSLYSSRTFSNTRSVWLKSVCHYIIKGYTSAAPEIFDVLAMVSCVCLILPSIHHPGTILDVGTRQRAVAPTSAMDCA